MTCCYTNGAEAAEWRDKYSEGVPDAGKKLVAAWMAAKLAYEARKTAA